MYDDEDHGPLLMWLGLASTSERILFAQFPQEVVESDERTQVQEKRAASIENMATDRGHSRVNRASVAMISVANIAQLTVVLS